MVYVSLVNNTAKKHLSLALSMGLQYKIFFENRKHEKICENENMKNTIDNAKKITLPSLLSITSDTSIGSHLGSSTAISITIHHSPNHSGIGVSNLDNIEFSPNGQFKVATFGYNKNTNSNNNESLNQFHGIGSDLGNCTFLMERSTSDGQPNHTNNNINSNTNNNNNSSNNSTSMNENNMGNRSEYLSSDVDINLTNLASTIRTKNTKRIDLSLTRPTTKHLDDLSSTTCTEYYTGSNKIHRESEARNNTALSIGVCYPRAEPTTNKAIGDNHLLNNAEDIHFDSTRNESKNTVNLSDIISCKNRHGMSLTGKQHERSYDTKYLSNSAIVERCPDAHPSVVHKKSGLNKNKRRMTGQNAKYWYYGLL